MVEYKDAIRDQTTTTGVGTLTIDCITTQGSRTIASGHNDGAIVHYRVNSADQSQWEIGEGTWSLSAKTLTRATVYASSNSGALVSLSDGVKTVITCLVAADLMQAATPTVASLSPLLLMGA